MRQKMIWAFLFSMACSAPLLAQTPPTDRQREYLNFIKAQAAQLRAADKPPVTRQEWEARRGDIRKHLQQSFGTFPETPCPLEPKVLGVLQRDGYRIENLVYESRLGVFVTANVYLPWPLRDRMPANAKPTRVA